MGSIALSGAVSANEIEQDLLLSDVINATPLKRVAPRYPIKAARRGQEGWVVMSFVVGKDGKVTSPIVESSSNGHVFDREARRAVKQWVYQPSTANGKAIEVCHNTIRFDFTMPKEKVGVRRRFASAYKKVSHDLKEKQYDLAKEKLDKLRSKNTWNLYEDANLDKLSVSYYSAIDDDINELKHLKRLNGANTSYFSSNQQMNSLARAYQLQVKFKDYMSAMYSFKKIEKLDSDSVLLSQLKKINSSIKNHIATGANYTVNGSVGEYGVWPHQLARNSFGFVNDISQLDKVEVRCKKQRITYSIAKDTIWDIPKSWGACTLYIHGKQGAPISLVEINRTQATVAKL